MKRFIFFVFLIGLTFGLYSTDVDSLKAETYFKTLEFDTIFQKALKIRDTDSLAFLSLVDEGIKLAEKRNNDREKAVFLYQLMVYNRETDNIIASNKYTDQVIELYNQNPAAFIDGEIICMVGQCYEYEEQYDKAYKFYLEAIKIFDRDKSENYLVYTTYSSAAYMARLLGDYDNAKLFGNKALDYAKKQKNEQLLGYETNNLGNTYLDLNEFDQALEYYSKSLEYKKKTGERDRLGGAYNNIATIYYYKGDLKSALENFKLAVYYYEEKNFDMSALVTSYMNVSQVYSDLNQFEKAIYYGKLAIETARKHELRLNESWSVNTLQEVYAKLGNYKEAYDLALVYHSLTDSLFKAEVAENLARMKTEYSLFESEKTKEIQALKIKRQHVIITTAVFLVLLLIILVWQVIRNSIMQKKAMILLQKEQQRSEELLQSILPEEIISEMKERGKSQPRLFYDAAVLNIDIVGFTEIADKSSPDSLFEKINEVFTICDDICIRNNCQRIKTSGDSYLAVSGMFHRDSDYKEKLFVTAVEIMQEMKRHFPDLKFRAGISCGRIIGAVVGKKNFIYDIFGSTVNTAFRMQEAAEPGTICIDGGMEKVLGDIYQFGESYEITIKGKSYLTWKVQVDRINS